MIHLIKKSSLPVAELMWPLGVGQVILSEQFVRGWPAHQIFKFLPCLAFACICCFRLWNDPAFQENVADHSYLSISLQGDVGASARFWPHFLQKAASSAGASPGFGRPSGLVWWSTKTDCEWRMASKWYGGLLKCGYPKMGCSVNGKSWKILLKLMIWPHPF